jgi:hypothetical protein
MAQTTGDPVELAEFQPNANSRSSIASRKALPHLEFA